MAVISFVITSINALFACLHFHVILSEHPGGYHPSGALGIQPQVASQLLSLLIRELIWQKLQHIGRPSFARLHSLLLRLHDSISAPISRSGIVQKLILEIGPSVNTLEKYRIPLLMVVEAFQLNRMVTRSVTLCVPTRVCPY